MWQLAKKLESSKATAHHIKQVAGDPQAVEINLPRHQCTGLPASKYKKKRPLGKFKQTNHKYQGSDSYKPQVQQKKKFDTKGVHNARNRCSKCGDTVHLEGFQCPAKKYQCKACHKFGHFTSMCYQKKHTHTSNQGVPRHTTCKQAPCMHATVHHMTTWMMTALLMTHFACKWRSNAIKQKNKGFQG